MKIRHRLVLALAALAAVAVIAIDLTAGRLIDRAVFDRSLERLTSESGYLAARLDQRWPLTETDADAWADQAGSSLGARVTVIDSSGRVLGDSQVPQSELASLENHRDRPEVLQAAREGVGRSVRHSESIGVDMQYLARRIGDSSRLLGYVRLALPAAELRAASRSYRTPLTFVSFGALILMTGVAYAILRRFSRPIETISRAADEVASGRYDVTIERDSDDELGRLFVSVDRMRRALKGQIDQVETERRLLASILGGLREGIMVVDQDRRLLLINEALRKALSLNRPTPEGTPMIEVLWDRSVVDAYEEALSAGEEVRARVAIPAGRSFELTVVPFSHGGRRSAGAIGLFFDVTRLDALERVRRDFVADISHELRTPLASVKASAETLQAGAIEDGREARRFLEILLKNTGRMEAILNDLTDLSLLETGAITLTLDAVDLAAAVRDSVAAIAPRAASRDVAVELLLAPGLLVRADRRRLDQILTNLLDNAVKFNRRGGSVQVRARRGGDTVVLQVEDSGPGIPPGSLDRIFNRLYRVDRARSQEVPGTGLGLSIVKHLVRLHGGRIWAENREEGGSRFLVELPPADPGAP